MENERANGCELVGVDILVLGAATAGLTRSTVGEDDAGRRAGRRTRKVELRRTPGLSALTIPVQFDQIPEFSVTCWPTCTLAGHETGR
jgi:hypothetical protein